MALSVKTTGIKPSVLMRGFGAICANAHKWPTDADWTPLDRLDFLESVLDAGAYEQLADLEEEYWILHGRAISLMKVQDALQGRNERQFERDAFGFIIKERAACEKRIKAIRELSMNGSAALREMLDKNLSGLNKQTSHDAPVTAALVPGQGLSFWTAIPDTGGIWNPPFTVRLDVMLWPRAASDRW